MKHITIAIVALSLSAANLVTAQDEIFREMQPEKNTSKSSSVKQLKDKYVIECGDLSVCGVSASTICTEGYAVDYITGSDSNYTIVIKCKKEIAPVPATVTVPVTVTVPNQEPIPEPEPAELEPEPEPEPEEPSNGLGLRIAGSIFLGDSAVNVLAVPIYCDSLSYDADRPQDEYYDSCIRVMGTAIIVEAAFGAVLLSSGIIKKAVVKSKTNRRVSVNGPSLLVKF